jgi:hypothetical protein
MTYKNTNEFQNTYELDYYIESNSIFIEGFKNRISVPIPSLRSLRYVIDTKFPFIIKFYKNNQSEDVEEITELWTSEEYYNVLQTSITDRNPFYSVETSTIIKIYLPQIINLIQNQKPFETQLGLELNKVLGIDTNNFTDIEYAILVKYIDWTVRKDRNIDDSSLIPFSELIESTIVE